MGKICFSKCRALHCSHAASWVFHTWLDRDSLKRLRYYVRSAESMKMYIECAEGFCYKGEGLIIARSVCHCSPRLCARIASPPSACFLWCWFCVGVFRAWWLHSCAVTRFHWIELWTSSCWISLSFIPPMNCVVSVRTGIFDLLVCLGLQGCCIDLQDSVVKVEELERTAAQVEIPGNRSAINGEFHKSIKIYGGVARRKKKSCL